ncbi:MAG: protein kinase domain-containing protein [Planctomycetota bacterium]|jgi:serine/threonine-protein kinase
MSLAAGTRLGNYEILAPLGQGGMGEVYRARDQNLDREVAIKVLPELSSQEPERIQRFEREAKLLANLSHTYIAAVYGFDTADELTGGESGNRSGHYLVLEYVEGVTLAQRLGESPLSVEDSLEVCRQIAEGLGAAHDAGIVHRDLKPANVMLKGDGSVKILDFGLGRALAEESSSHASVESRTITSNFTKPGVVLGTAPYMSPEQARGRSIDRRTDIWAFGCLLFECLTGKILFAGESATDSIGAILHKDPDWALLPSDTPPTVLLLLRRCLAKDKNRRLQAIGDARVELQEAIADPTASAIGLATAALGSAKKAKLRAGTFGLMLLVAAIASLATIFLQPALPEPQVQRFSVVMPTDLSMASRFSKNFDVSADGRVMVLLGSQDGSETRLFIREANQTSIRPLDETGFAVNPVLSSDGQWVVNSGNGLFKRSTRGGPPVTLWESDGKFARSPIEWTEDGWLYFLSWSGFGSSPDQANTELYRVSENGGEAQHLVDAERCVDACVLPGGSVLLTRVEPEGAHQIMVWRPGTTALKELVPGRSPRWSATGHLLFVRSGTLMAATFDPAELSLGPAVPVIEGIATNPTAAQYDLTSSGTLYHIAGLPGAERPAAQRMLVQIGLDGKVDPLAVQTGPYRMAVPSPDGQRVLVILEQRRWDREGARFGILDLRRDVLTPLSSFRGHLHGALWSPDGQWIYYGLHNSEILLHRLRTDGSSETGEEIPGGRDMVPTSFSADGSRLYVTHSVEGSADIAFLRLDEDFRREEVVSLPGDQTEGVISPDGNWLAYVAEDRVYICAANGAGGRVQVSRGEGENLTWSADGTSLFYSQSERTGASRRGGREIMRVTIESPGDAPVTLENLQVSSPEKHFSAPSGLSSFHLLPKGEGYLAINPVDSEEEGTERSRGTTEILVTLNFASELERLTKTGAK